MDRINHSTIIVKHWFLFMGLFRLASVILLVLLIFLRLFEAITIYQFKKYESLLIIIWIYIQSSWMVFSVILFMFVMSQNCVGGIFAYGLILTIVHIFLIIAFVSLLIYIRVTE